MRLKYPLFIICFTLACSYAVSGQTIQSVYTDLKGNQCKTLERDDEAAGYLLEQCPGVGRFRLQIVSGDDRQTVTVVKPNGSKHELNLGQVGGGGFSYIGEKAEWRVKRENGRIVPVALIVRLNVSTNPLDSSKTTSYLTVSKITPQKICLVEAIEPKPNANEAARVAADSSASMACYETRAYVN
jgi:hypothetical protein